MPDGGEEIFAPQFDGRVARRFLAFLKPYTRPIAIAIGAVLLFTMTQIAVPLVIRHVVDGAVAGAEARRELAIWVSVFFGVVLLNYVSNYRSEEHTSELQSH